MTTIETTVTVKIYDNPERCASVPKGCDYLAAWGPRCNLFLKDLVQDDGHVEGILKCDQCKSFWKAATKTQEKQYKIISNRGQIAVIVSTSFKSPLDQLKMISDDLIEARFYGEVIFDLLLCNGVSSNRFASFYFDSKYFNDESLCVSSTCCQREETEKYYLANPGLFKGSVLTEGEIKALKTK